MKIETIAELAAFLKRTDLSMRIIWNDDGEFEYRVAIHAGLTDRPTTVAYAAALEDAINQAAEQFAGARAT